MTTIRFAVPVLAMAAVLTPVAAGHAGARQAAAVAVRAASLWGQAIEVPGLGALNAGGSAEVSSVSCGSAGDCAAGGYYTDASGHRQGFVAVERRGVWDQAIEVPGLAALNAGGSAEVSSVSCGSAGDCAAGGYYTDASGHRQGFVAVERRGVWGQAIEVPGLAALTAGGSAEVSSVSCGSAGDCAAGGSYTVASDATQGFVVSLRYGVWGQAIEVPGVAALTAGGTAQVVSVSCGPAGDCAAGGSYTLASDATQGFVAVERGGVWGRAIEVPGLAALNYFGDAAVVSVSCGPAGNCAAGGFYMDRSGFRRQGFLVSQRNGVWGRAFEVRGLDVLNASDAQVSSVSCALAGNCVAGGFYRDSAAHDQGFVVRQRRGVWGRATVVPGLGALNTDGDAQVSSVSCGSAGSCAAGGSYPDLTGDQHGFVVSGQRGVWRRAIGVPGLDGLNTLEAAVVSVSCSPAGSCVAGGYYQPVGSGQQGFVVGERSGV